MRRLWAEGKLPHLKALADRGVTATLRTAYNSSPVIWTTIATGVTPREHGITDFVVADPAGRRSDLFGGAQGAGDLEHGDDRRAAGGGARLVGLVARRGGQRRRGERPGAARSRCAVSRRLRICPGSSESSGGRARSRACSGADDEPETAGPRDRPRGGAASPAQGFDLLLVYFRSPDIVSHNHWKYLRARGRSRDSTSGRSRRTASRVPRSYEAVDEAVGRILAAAPRETQRLRDLGSRLPCRPARGGQDPARHGRRPGAARLSDAQRSRGRLRSHADLHVRHPLLPAGRSCCGSRWPAGSRVDGSSPPSARGCARRLAADLAAVTYESGAPVFVVRDPPSAGGEGGCRPGRGGADGGRHACTCGSRGSASRAPSRRLSRISGHPHAQHARDLPRRGSGHRSRSQPRRASASTTSRPRCSTVSGCRWPRISPASPGSTSSRAISGEESGADDPLLGEAEGERRPDVRGGREAARGAPGARLSQLSSTKL